MTTEEFSNEFDTLVSSYRRFKNFDSKEELDSIEFDEFEKSQFLTTAQEKVVTELYSGQTLAGFESTEQLRRYLDSLVKYSEVNLEDKLTASHLPKNSLCYYKVDLKSQIENLLFITYESVSFNDTALGCKNGTTVQVTPVRQDELAKIVKNPFRGPSASRVLRVDAGSRVVDLISKYALATYYLYYLEKPTPIILVPLPEGLTIEGESTVMSSELDSSLHRIILQKAVQMAIASKVPSSTKG